jgi:phage shock protein C
MPVYTSASSSLINRPDTLLGVCEGIGQTFGFHPNLLRIALAVCLLANPVVVIACYLALGVAVAISRLIVPMKRRPAALPAEDEALDTAPEPVALAA